MGSGVTAGPARFHHGHNSGRGSILFPYPYYYSDFGYDIIPKLVAENKQLFGYELKNELIAIDTPELYALGTEKLHTDPHEMC